MLPTGDAVGLTVQVLSGRLPPHQAVVFVGNGVYELAGSLSSAIRPGAWRYQGSNDDYSLFLRTRAPTPLYTVTDPGGSTQHIDVLSTGPNAESIRVRATSPVVVVRDVAWDSGWHASVSTNGGPFRTVKIDRHGLVQAVRLSAATNVVRFSYRPPHWSVASALSVGSSLLLVILLVAMLLRRRRRALPHTGPG